MNLWISKSDFILKKKFHSYLFKKKNKILFLVDNYSKNERNIKQLTFIQTNIRKTNK